jgi:AcrR family transcriptional regulator
MSSVKRESRQERRVEETRAAIVEAAELLFIRDGYARTTIGDIAEEAGVVVQTIYNAVGPKSTLLSAVLDRAAAGPMAPRSVPEFMSERSVQVSDASEMADMLADWFAEVQPRVVGINRVIHEAAASDPAVAELEVRRASQRLRNYGQAADAFARLPGARDLPREHIAATIWSIGHPQSYEHLTQVEGWSRGRYRDWVARALAGALVVDSRG